MTAKPKDATTPTRKRQLKATPTLREQVDQAANQPVKRRRKSLLTLPFRFVFGSLFRLGRLIVRSRFGQAVAAVWRSRLLTPLRLIVRLLSKILLVQYFKNAYRELQGVTWPDTRTTWRLTGAVLIFSLIFGLIIAGLDYVLENVFRKVILDL